VEATDPDPTYFDDVTAAGAEQRRAQINAELDAFIEMLGGRSIEANRKAEVDGKQRVMQAGALTDGVETEGGVQHNSGADA
jgi:hypothetical protein